MKKFVRFIAVLFLTTSLWGCAERAVVTERPREPVEVRPAAPRADYVWINGEWRNQGGRYTYKNGYWAAPRQGHVYASGHWARRGRGWYWIPGHW